MEQFIGLIVTFLFGVAALTVKAVIALVIVFSMLRYANKANKVSIEAMLKKLDEDPRAVSDYYGRRLIAAAIIVLGVSIGSI